LKPQLKPGCLAEVVLDVNWQENLGRIVTVQQPCLGFADRVWWVTAPGLIWGWRHSDAREIVDRRFYDHECLRPIADPDAYTHRDHVVELTREKCDAALDKLGLVV